MTTKPKTPVTTLTLNGDVNVEIYDDGDMIVSQPNPSNSFQLSMDDVLTLAASLIEHTLPSMLKAAPRKENLPTLESIELWHMRARPQPTSVNLSIQSGCHFEEVSEMIESFSLVDARGGVMPGGESQAFLHVKTLADQLKSGVLQLVVNNRKEFLDSIGDQVVTAIGSGWCANMSPAEACARVNASNWTKYDKDGNPIFKPSGKIDKGPDYIKPDLAGLY